MFKSLVRLVSLGVLLGAVFTTEAAPSLNVAYRRIDVQDAATGELFPVALWYPTRAAPAPLFLTGSLSACRLPAVLCRLIAFEMQVAQNAPPADAQFGLIVISHGARGLALNHRDLAMALAAHGYVVAAPTHPRGKDNDDVSGVGVWVGRPKQVSRVIDAVLGDAELGSHIQRGHIGVVGHSNGGYTALAVAGAKPTPAAIVAHCRQHPDDATFCSYGGAATRDATQKVHDIPDVRDPRVRAIVLMAPNVAPFTDDALARVAVPVRVYGAERDDLTLVRYHAERLAKALPSQAEFVLLRGAGHFSFVASFPRALALVAGEAARDPEGFDREAMHAVMNPEIVGFFDRRLPSPQHARQGTAADTAASLRFSTVARIALPDNLTLRRVGPVSLALGAERHVGGTLTKIAASERSVAHDPAHRNHVSTCGDRCASCQLRCSTSRYDLDHPRQSQGSCWPSVIARGARHWRTDL